MLPQERPAFLRMTFVALVIDGGLVQQSFSVATVRIVAGRARHLPFANGHMRRAPDFRALVFVTLEARVDLSQLGQLELRRDVRHDRVAIRTGEPARLMRAAAPQRAPSLLVA